MKKIQLTPVVLLAGVLVLLVNALAGLTLQREIRVNLHRYYPVNLSDWTDVENDTQGIRIAGVITETDLYDTNGNDANATLTIENINLSYSEHYGAHVNSAGVQIGDFPAGVTRSGLRLRDPFENPCVLVFEGLYPDRYYDVIFTGYTEGSGSELNATLYHTPSGKSASIDVRNNTVDTGQLSELQTDAYGRLDIGYMTTTASGQPNISAVILREYMEVLVEPDTTTNRYATSEDAAYWSAVNEGDYIFFTGNTDGGDKIYAMPGWIHVTLPVGGKILIWEGEYERILIEGSNCASTAETPTIVTNLGGQVKVGYSEENNIYRGFDLVNFENLHLSGKYDPVAQTGDEDFKGHDEGNAFDSGDYYEKYGLWAYSRWSGPMYHGSYGNGVRIAGSKYVKIDYVSSWGGSFAAFNIKTDNPTYPGEVEMDIQDCFAGFGEGEGFYISYSGFMGQDLTKLTMRNNIVICAGAEAFQTGSLLDGSVIENNVAVVSATFYRHPFMAGVQDNLLQISALEGEVNLRNNLFVGTNGGLHLLIWGAAEPGRLEPSVEKPFRVTDNYFGFSRNEIGYVWQGDGVTPYEITGNVYGPISTPGSDESDPAAVGSGYMNIGNDNNPITLEDNIYSQGRSPYYITRGSGANLSSSNNSSETVPVINFKNTGFPNDIDYRRISFWAPYYKNTPSGYKDNDPIPYAVGDIVVFYDSTGQTKFFLCIEEHAGDQNPNTATAYWEQLTWNGRAMPPLDVRVVKDTYYNYRGIGLTYNEANELSADLEAPVITLDGLSEVEVVAGESYVEEGYEAIDNRDGDISANVELIWVGEEFDGAGPGRFRLLYRVTDAAGNVSQDVFRDIIVIPPYLEQSRVIRVNFHRYGAAGLSGWTDMANDAQGIRINRVTTVTDLYDSDDNDALATLSIENIDQGYTEHYGVHNNSAGRIIDEFPAAVTKGGLRIRNPHENPCVLVFEGFDPEKYYDIKATGYTEGSGDVLNAILYHEDSEQVVAINVRDNVDEVAVLRNVQPDELGKIEIVFTTDTANGQPNLSGMIITEYEQNIPEYVLEREIRVNLHRYYPANLTGWSDAANDTQGIRILRAPTYTNLYDSEDNDAYATLTIENIDMGYSEHYGAYVNTAGVQIGDFPPEVTRSGLRLRDPHENLCVLVFDGFDPDKWYDVYFTGYQEGSGCDMDVTLMHYASSTSDSINIRGNCAEIGNIGLIQPDSGGTLELMFTTTTSFAQPNISGLIIREYSSD